VKANTAGSRPELVFEADLPEAAPSKSAPAVSRVRHAAIHAIDGHPAAQVAAVVISELLTNAVRHGGCQCTLRVFDGARSLLIEVEDSSPKQPVLGPALKDNFGGSGRGLQMVKALSDTFGVKPLERCGKIVWASICC
jgi:anti-sigma regulatory factor (Ser/Thr protein kinase)